MAAVRTDPDAAALSALAQIARAFVGARGGDLGYRTLKQGFREAVQRDPLDTILVSVLGGAYLFWLAEKDHNPKCRTFWDAAVFVSTCLSVGYDNVFARTESGKAIATFLMTFGPSVAAAAFNPPAAERGAAVSAVSTAATAESIALQRAIVARLDALIGLLGAQPPEDGSLPQRKV
jgi:hypothetical protein